MSVYERQVGEAADATVVLGPTAFSWFGKRPPRVPAAIRRSLPPEVARDYLLSTLQEQLYTHFYCQGYASPLRWQGHEQRAPSLTTPLVEELSVANSGTGYWENGWVVRAVERDVVLAARDGLHLRVAFDDCLVAGGRAEPGASISLRLPREFPAISPGFYVAAGNAGMTTDDWRQVVRLYWNLTPRGAVRLMAALTTTLNEAGVPFRLKVASGPAGFARCDVAVLYLRAADYARVRERLVWVHRLVAGESRPGVPALTRWIAGGVGLAEEPPEGPSFGLHRCRILADGLISAHEEGLRSASRRLRRVAERFAEEGISLERPFLNPRSSDVYGAPFATRPRRRETDSTARNEVELDADRCLETACAVGLRLCREALWHGDRCTWIGASVTEVSGVTQCALGPDLYGGTGGVGLFLAELSAATGRPEFDLAAIGAIRQALARAGALPTEARLGLYSGRVGIALAAARAGMLLGKEEIVRGAGELLRLTAREHRPGGPADLISGNAGAAVGLVALSGMLGDPSLLDFASRLGDELLETAVESAGGCSWRTVNDVGEYHLTGLSHGTAGIGLGLLELFASTGEPRYRRTAEMAFRYERRWFDAGVGNWPDLREARPRGSRARHALAFSTYWCHGAPGIALARLRAHQVLGDPAWLAEAATALRTTLAMVEDALDSRNVNFSLCHGLAGNAEVLRIGGQVLGEEYRTGPATADRVAEAGVRLYASLGREWPCGTPGGTTPGLMAGLAGIGHFYLRSHSPAVPSPLCWTPPATSHQPAPKEPPTCPA